MPTISLITSLTSSFNGAEDIKKIIFYPKHLLKATKYPNEAPVLETVAKFKANVT